MPERDGPLQLLGRKMLSLGPPSLSALTSRLGEVEEYESFIKLVREFLPEREQDILREPTPARQMAAFASYFEDRYFPLDDNIKLGEAESYQDVTRAIPVIVRGLSWDDYHSVASDWRPGIQLMTYLMEPPYEGARLALAEACQEHVPASLLEQVPGEGLSPAEAHRLVDGTPYKALGLWGDMVHCDTGNFFLDTDYETLWNGDFPLWSQETVQALTRQWQQADLVEEEIAGLAEWLEEDPAARFGEMLSFMLEKARNDRKDETSKGAKGLPVGAPRVS